jgi:hypothetical protein
MYKLCQELVWLDSGGHSNTYCMRAIGHQGKHNPAGNFEPVEAQPATPAPAAAPATAA